jgi:hypothetical protein
MSTAADLLLLATDPESGKPGLGMMEVDYVLGGAMLYDLVSLERLQLDGKGRKARVTVADPSPAPDAALEAAFARVRDRRPSKAQSIVGRLGKHGQKNLYRVLTEEGSVRPREEKALGLFPLTRHDVLDTARRDQLLQRIRGALLHGQEPDAETGPLIGLLSAGELVKLVVDKPDRKRAKKRAAEIAEGDWASESVKAAIQAARAAMTAAVVASTAATAGSS